MTALALSDRPLDHVADFPAIPAPFTLFMNYVMPLFKGGIFKFSSCDIRGVPQEMPYAPKKG